MFRHVLFAIFLFFFPVIVSAQALISNGAFGKASWEFVGNVEIEPGATPSNRTVKFATWKPSDNKWPAYSWVFEKPVDLNSLQIRFVCKVLEGSTPAPFKIGLASKSANFFIPVNPTTNRQEYSFPFQTATGTGDLKTIERINFYMTAPAETYRFELSHPVIEMEKEVPDIYAGLVDEFKKRFPVTAVAGLEPFSSGERVVFAGDSITHSGSYHRYIELFYATRYPERTVTALNSGIGGSVAQDLLNRFDVDIAGRQPTVVTLMLGMNDAGGSYAGKTAEEIEAFRKSQSEVYQAKMTQLGEKILQTKSKFILLTPTPYDQTGDLPRQNQPGKNDTIHASADWLYAQAKVWGVSVVDFWQPMQFINLAMQAKDPKWTLISDDRTHPREPGHLVMTYLFLKSQGVNPIVANMELDAASKSFIKKEKVSIQDESFENGKITFSALEKSLPFPVEPNAMIARKIVPFDEINQELFSVRHLPKGNYLLSIDDVPIKTISAEILEAGLNLAYENKTPQWIQAQVVQSFNNQRNAAETILRSVMYIRLAMKKANVNESDDKAKKQFIDGIKDWSKGLVPAYLENESKISEVEQMRDAFQVEMLKAAQPKIHRYKIELVAK
jgi:lysophospholipase L1-like esterase